MVDKASGCLGVHQLFINYICITEVVLVGGAVHNYFKSMHIIFWFAFCLSLLLC